jgi:AcrR family transcriptional regulator
MAMEQAEGAGRGRSAPEAGAARGRGGNARQRGVRGHLVRDPELAEARRRSILLAAAVLFGEKGYEAATLDDIAQAVGITKGGIYHYFLSKEDIFYEIRVTAIKDALERLEAILARGLPPSESLRLAVSDLVSHILTTPLERHANVLSNPPSLGRRKRQAIRQLQRRYEGAIQGIIAQGMERGEFRAGEPKLAAFTVLRTALGVAWWYQQGGPWPQDLIVEQVTDQVLYGLVNR